MAALPEKTAAVYEIETLKQDASAVYDAELDARISAYSPEEQRKLVHRVDRRLVIILGLIFSVELMDRTNLGIAAIAGMAVDLDLIGERYSTIALVFFITYTLMQPIATVLMRKIGPHIFLPTTALLLGISTICCGFVKAWGDLVVLRIFIGVFEASFFPSCAYLLSAWYCRYELQKRNTAFYLIGVMATAFAGILGYGFSQLKNHGSGPVWWGQNYGPTTLDPDVIPGILPGIAGWRWIFILQGVLSCVIALLGYPLIVNFPEVANKSWGPKFLTEQEADFFVARIEKDRKDAILEPFHLGQYLKHALDLKVLGFAAIFGLNSLISYAIVFFLPIILEESMGFDTPTALCLTSPPYVASAVVMSIFAWIGDKYHLRSPFIIFNSLMLLTGLPLLGYAENVGARYFGVFLAVAACNSNIPCILTWQANNIRGQWKRAVCSATLVAAGGVGGIIGTLVFRSQDAPSYRPGIWTTIIASVLILVITLLLDFKFRRANKRADSGGKLIAKLKGFRYTL